MLTKTWSKTKCLVKECGNLHKKKNRRGGTNKESRKNKKIDFYAITTEIKTR
jgi:hypothetical protein